MLLIVVITNPTNRPILFIISKKSVAITIIYIRVNLCIANSVVNIRIRVKNIYLSS